MRFAIAAGILYQTLQVSSHRRISRLGDDAKSRRKVQEFLLQAETLGDRPAVTTNPEERADGSFEEKYSSFFSKFVLDHAVEMKNNPVADHVECNPELEDADAGILSCGEGKYCMESETSELGGLCMNEGLNRNLQTGIGYFAPVLFCDSSSPYFVPGVDCDCSGLDLTTGLGVVSCLYEGYCFDKYNTTCANVYSIAYNYGPGNHTEYTCYDFYTPYNQTVCYVSAFYQFQPFTVACSINDEYCNYCIPSLIFDSVYNITQPCTLFDCSNTCGMHTGETCSGGYVAPILIPEVTGTCNMDDGPEDPTPSPVEMGTPAPVMEETTSAPVVGETTPPPRRPTYAPVTPAPTGPPVIELTAAPVLSPTEAPTGAGVALWTQKTAISLFGLSMGLLAYFTA